MSGIVMMIIAIVVLGGAYLLYGRYLQNKWGIDPKAKTPAYEMEDGVDYVPADTNVVFGHQFASIAGAGPINGPIQAAIFGWLPVMLWILIGGVFFGAVQDFASMYASVKNQGRTIGYIIEAYIGKLGKKLFITGKGRCNVTNDCDEETFFSSVITNSKFLYSSYYGCTSQNVMDFFTSIGVKLKTERGNRVYPPSDHYSDIIRALEHKKRETKVQVHLRTEVTDILSEENCIKYVVTAQGKEAFDKVIVATGGYSYQATGATGDGYRFAENTGQSVTKIRPALVPLEVKEDYITKLQGLALKNVQLTIKDQKKKLYEEFGELLFTHFGVSGPLVLTASSKIGKQLE